MTDAENLDFSLTLRHFLPEVPREETVGSEVAKNLIAQKFTEIGQLVLGQLQKPAANWEERMQQSAWVDMAFTLIDPLGATGFKTEAAALTLGCYASRRQAWIAHHPNTRLPEEFLYISNPPVDGLRHLVKSTKYLPIK